MKYRADRFGHWQDANVASIKRSDAVDFLLAGLTALLAPLALFSWLLQARLMLPDNDERVRLVLAFVPGDKPRSSRQTVPLAASAIEGVEAGVRRGAGQSAGAVSSIASRNPTVVVRKALDLKLATMAQPEFETSTKRNLGGSKDRSTLDAKPKTRFSLRDSSFLGRWADAQRSSVCADLLSRLRNSQGGPSSQVILESLIRHDCEI